MADAAGRWSSWLSVVASDRTRVGTIRLTEVVHAVRVAIACVLSWWLASLAGLSSAPYMASLACLLYVQPSVYESFTRAIQRLVGVVLGVGLGVAIFTFTGVNAFVVGLVVFVGLLAATVLRLGPGGSVQIAVSGLIVLAITSTNPGYPGQRILETMLGVGVGLAVVIVTAPPTVGPAERAAASLVSQAVLVFTTMGQVLAQGWSPRSAETMTETARELRDISDEARVSVERASESLRFNPRGRSARQSLTQARLKVETLHPMSRRAMTTVNILNEGTEGTAPMPHLSRLLWESGRVIDAYGAWCDSPLDTETRRCVDAQLATADEAWSAANTAVEERWKERPDRWLRFGMVLPLCGLVTTQVRRGLNGGLRQLPPSGPSVH
jgi:uncharacterized membrane protein YgaE (UPF0421/DUF939 family)